MLDIFFSNTDSRRNHCDSRKNIWLHAVQSKYVRSQHGTDLFLGFRVTERTSNAKHSRFHCAHGFAYLATTTSGKETTNKNAINGINNCAANENANDFYLPQNWWQYLKQTTVSRHIAHVLTLVVIWFFHSGIAVFPLASHLSHKSFLRWCDIALHAFWLVFHRSFERRAQMNWCASIHLRVWQLVPIMSIGWRSWMLFAGHTYSNQIQRRAFHRWCHGSIHQFDDFTGSIHESYSLHLLWIYAERITRPSRVHTYNAIATRFIYSRPSESWVRFIYSSTLCFPFTFMMLFHGKLSLMMIAIIIS